MECMVSWSSSRGGAGRRSTGNFTWMQGDIYLKGDSAQSGIHEAAVDKMVSEQTDYVVFNGSAGSLGKDHPLKAKVGETVRIFFGNAGPNAVSSFHVIG